MRTNRPHLPRPACILLLPCLILTFPPAIRAAELTTSDGGSSRSFTGAVGLSGSAGIAGAPYKDGAGAAYFFRNLDTASGTITQSVTLNASGRPESAFFGASTALSGNNGLVGAPTLGVAAYFFRNLNTASGTVTENAALIPSDGSYGEFFGNSVSLSGNVGLVGAYTMDTSLSEEGANVGAAYLYRNLDTASGTVKETARLAASDGARGDYLGRSVSLSGNAGLVGAYGKDDFKGAAYLYRNLDTASGRVTENAKLTASGGNVGSFGTAVSLSGNAGLVTAYEKDNGIGVAYLFRGLDTASGTVTENARLTGSDAAAGSLGGAVSLSGNAGLAAGGGNDGKGAAYLFRNLEAVSGTVTENVRLTASGGAANDYFGSSLTLDGDRFVIGATGSGKAYSGRVSAFTTLDEGGATRATDRLSFVSQDDWVIGQDTDGNRLTLSAGDSGTVSAAGRKVMVGWNAGSDHNVLTVNGSLSTNSVQVGALGNTGNALWVGGGGIVTTTGGVIVTAGSSVGGDGILNGDLRFSAASLFAFTPDQTVTLTVNGNVRFDGSFGAGNLLGLDSSTPNGTYTLIDGTPTDFAASGLANWGQANAYDLGGGKSAWFEQGSLKLVVVPESGTGLLALLAGTSLILHRRPSRRR